MVTELMKHPVCVAYTNFSDHGIRITYWSSQAISLKICVEVLKIMVSIVLRLFTIQFNFIQVKINAYTNQMTGTNMLLNIIWHI